MGATLAMPPTGNSAGGESRGVMGNANRDRAVVSKNVINAIGNRHADGIGTEIVIVDILGLPVPAYARVFE